MQAQPLRRVLVIAYYFPPMGLSGVQRTLKFVKYLPDFGWLPTVLTVDERGYYAKDEGLLTELEGRNIKILRSPSMDPFHFFRKKNVIRVPSGRRHSILSRISQSVFFPDNKIGWKKHALRAAREELTAQTYDVIFATAPPYTSFLIAKQLKKEFGIPLVFDYRDAWLKNPLHFYITPLHREIHRMMEANVLRYANHIITINRRIKQITLESHGSLKYTDVSIIPQGFDGEDFALSNNVRTATKMRFTYSGMFYYNRTPQYFLQALKLFFTRHPAARNDVEACFIGTAREEDAKYAVKLGLENQTRFVGYVSHGECIQYLLDSDVLWMMIGKDKGDDMVSTGKLYEYIGTRKPILALIPDGVARQTLSKYQAAFISEPDDVEDIASHIEKLYHLYKQKRLPTGSADFASQFERKTLTGELAKIFASVLHLGSHESRVVTQPAPQGRNTHNHNT